MRKFIPISCLAEVNPRTARPTDKTMEVSFIPMSDVSESGQWTEHKIKKLSEVSQGFTAFQDDDVLFAKITPCMENGKGALVHNLRNRVGFGSTEFHVLRAKPGRADPGYIFHWLNYFDTREKAKAFFTGSAGQQRVAASFFDFLLVPDITVDDQRGIAEVLSAMDEQIEATNVEIEKLNMQRQGLATSLLACKHLSESEIDDVRLSEVIPEVQYGISSSLAETGVIPVLRMNNLSGGEIDVSDLKFSPTDVHSGLYLKPNDVLFNRTNSMEHVGRTALWRGQLTKCTFASYLVRLSPDPKRLLPEYLVYLLEWDENQLQMRKYATPGVQQVNINPTSLRRCKVQIPKSLDVQRATIAALDTARENIESLKSEVEKLKLKKQGLMHDLLTGAVRVMEAN